MNKNAEAGQQPWDLRIFAGMVLRLAFGSRHQQPGADLASSSKMPLALGLILCLMSESLLASGAYLIIGARVINADDGRQPTWIAVRKARKLRHLSAIDAFFTLPPGSYALRHLDFGESRRSRSGTRYLPRLEDAKLIAGAVTVVGTIELDVRTGQGEIVIEKSLLEAACAANSDLIDNAPIYIYPDAKHPIRMRCTEASKILRPR